MLKHILLACIMAVSATPAFARDTYNFPIRLYDHEHDHDHADEHDQEGVEAYQTAVDNNFFINGGVLPESQTSFVLLPDGTHYVLDSKFWRAAQQLATLLLEEHEHGSISNDTWVLAPWQRLSDSVAGRLEPLIEDIQKKHFWVKLSATGVSLFRRYGLPAVVIIGGGETLEHGLCPLPIPLGCAAIYTAGTFSGKHVMRFWNLVRSEFPLEASAGQRMGSGFKQWQWNWQYWRAMKEVYHVSRENRRWLEEPDANSKMAAYFLSQEKSAFLEVQLKLAEQAVASIAKSHPLIFYAVNWISRRWDKRLIATQHFWQAVRWRARAWMVNRR